MLNHLTYTAIDSFLFHVLHVSLWSLLFALRAWLCWRSLPVKRVISLHICQELGRGNNVILQSLTVFHNIKCIELEPYLNIKSLT